MRGGMPSGIFGTVASVDGNILTVTQKMRPNAATTPETFTVDATNARIVKNGATSTVSSIATGDVVMAQGTVNGMNVAATMIRDGMIGMTGQRGMPTSSPRGMFGNAGKGFGRPTSTSSTSPIQGNGEPVVAGSITVINGSTVTVTNASNVTYTIDASNATIIKSGTTSTIASVAVGDNVIAQGTVNGTSVIATSIIDQGNGNRAGNAPTGIPPATPRGGFTGFFGAIGNFFKHIFGF